jgi:3-phosphoshikimate 1-carboxyvinyltransferase
MNSKLAFEAGGLGSSKSQLLRAHISASYSGQEFSSLFTGESACEDVLLMKAALKALRGGEREFDCGHSAALLRFLLLRLSRQKGDFLLRASPRLLERRNEEIYSLAAALGFSVQKSQEAYLLSSEGWKAPSGTLKVRTDTSSQFLSAVLLNSWNLDFPLRIEWPTQIRSESYLNLSLKILRDFAWQAENSGTSLLIPAGQVPRRATPLPLELDMSSAFALAALAAVAGYVKFENFPQHSEQGDRIFVELLARAGALVEVEEGTLYVEAQQLYPLELNLSSAPDLFPVLAALLSLSPGRSKLYGAEHLKWKESDRIRSTAELISRSAEKIEILDDGLIIYGRLPPSEALNLPAYDCPEDHRLAMAAAVLWHGGYRFKVNNGACVRKSFPDFWERSHVPAEYWSFER